MRWLARPWWWRRRMRMGEEDEDGRGGERGKRNRTR